MCSPITWYRLCLMAACMQLVQLASGQNMPHRIFTTEQGLPGNTVYDMLQDNEGYIWFATGSGVSRFDGRSFINFSIEDGLTDLDVLELFQDSKGRIWFLSLNGSACFWFEGKMHNEESDPFLAQIRLRSGIGSIQEDKDHNLWIGGVNYAYARITPDNKVEDFTAPLPHLFFAIDDLGELMFVNEHVVNVWRDGKFTAVYQLVPHIPGIAAAQPARETRLVVLDSTGIISINSTGIARTEIPRGAWPMDEVRPIINQDTKGNIFLFAKSGGLFLFRKSAQGFSPPIRLFSNYLINRILRDDEGNLWISTIGNGVLLVPSIAYDSGIESTWNELDGGKISAILRDDNERMLVGCSDGRVLYIKDDSTRLLQHGIMELGTSINDFSFYKNNIWWCSGQGVFRFDGTQVKPIPSSSSMDRNHRLPSGKRKLFVGPSDELYSAYYGIYHFMGDYFDVFYEAKISTNRINHAVFDSQGNLWYEQGEELFKLSPQGDLKLFNDYRKLFRGKITAILELDAQTMLIGTYGSGLYLMRGDTLFSHFVEMNGLAGNICRSVSLAGDTILVSTNKGLSVWKGKNGSLEFIQNITVEDGLPTNDIRCATLFRGFYQIGTTHGLFSVPVSISELNSIAPRLYLKNLSDFSGRQLDRHYFELQADNANIMADFSAVTYTNPGSVVFRYRLKESEDWFQTNEPSYSFSNLNPGEYQFEVQARKPNSDWSIPVRISFSIIVPWYKTKAFEIGLVVFVALLLIALISYVFRQRTLRDKLKLEKLEGIARERLRIASDVHDDLGADFSNLLLESRISSLDDKIPESERKFYHKMESIAEGALVKVDEIIWSLDPKEDNIDGFQSHIRKYFDSYLKHSGLTGRFDTNIGDDHMNLSSGQRRQLFLCVKEILHNVQKHAHASQVLLNVVCQNRKLVITISDNGRGFDEANGDRHERGYGLESIRRRLEVIHGAMEISSSPNGSVHVLLLSLN